MYSKYIFIISLLVVLFGCKEKESKSSVSDSAFPEIVALNAEIKKNPSNPSLYFERGKFYHEKASYDNAIMDMNKAISLDSLNPDYYHFLADCYLDYYNGKEAIKTMYRVLDLYPERVPSLLKLSELHYILEDYDSSILAVNEAFKVDPQNAECFFMLGVNFRALNDVERAINSFQSAVELDSGLTDAWIMLGELYENKKDPKALKYYENAVLSAPNSLEAKHAKAFYLQNNGNIPLALDLYNEIIMQDKYYENAYQNSGILYVEIDSFDKAYDQFNIMTGINPQNHMGFYLRGTVLKIKGNLSGAKLDFQSALNLKANDPAIINALKEVEEMLKKK